MRLVQATFRRARIVVAWVRMRLAEIHLHAVIDLLDRDIGKPMPHEQRKQLLLRRCFAELAADVRRQEYLDEIGLQEALRREQPAACIRRRARSTAC
jgi:hypothetical protein